MTIKKISYNEMTNRLRLFNRDHDHTKEHIYGVVVLKKSNWPDKDYSLDERSYKVSSDNKAFIDGMCGYSIFAQTLDKSDSCRLDWYLSTEKGNWDIDYCYMLDKEVA